MGFDMKHMKNPRLSSDTVPGRGGGGMTAFIGAPASPAGMGLIFSLEPPGTVAQRYGSSWFSPVAIQN